MKKFLVFIFAVAIFASCQKEETAAPASQEVVFSGIDSGSKKSTDVEGCENELADYAKVVIDGDIYRPAVFYIDGTAYTQAIKLDPAQYTVSEFMLLNDNGTPDNLTDDYIVKAAPMSGSEYADFVTTPLTFTFDVEAFKKAEVGVEVLCFDAAEYESFGFNWFAMTEITVREQVFFGDLCVADLASYETSLYTGQANGLQIDMPAIFRIDVYKNGSFVKSYDNQEWLGEGEPLMVQYPDHDNAADLFEFKLFVNVNNCDGFDYEYFHTWTFNDDEMISDGGDGVVDFVVGNCNYSNTDLSLGVTDWVAYKDLSDANNPNGFLYTDDPNQNLWKWTRDNTQGYANIANPIAVSLYKAGFEEIGLLGYESIYNFINDQYQNNTTGFSSASMFGLLEGYEATGNSDYLTLAENFFPQFMAKYPSDGSGSSPRDTYWGYDFMTLLQSAQIAADNGLTGAATFLAEWTAIYEADYVAKAAASYYHRIFINVIAVDLGIGTHQGNVDWTTIVADNDAAGYLSLQEGAYVVIGESYGDLNEVKAYLESNVCAAVYSQAAAEAIYAINK